MQAPQLPSGGGKSLVNPNPSTVAEQERLSHLSKDSADVIQTFTSVKLPRGKGKTIDMCKAIKEMQEESWRAGIEEGRESGIKEGRIEVLHSLIRKGMIPVSDAAQEMEISEEEFSKRYMEKVPEEKC